MVAMVVLAVVLGLVVLIGAGVWALRSRGGDEVQSVEGYRHTLDTLGDIQTRSGTGSVRVLGSSGEPLPPVPDAGAIYDPVEEEGPIRRPVGRRGPLVFDDAAPAPVLGRRELAAPARRDRAISSMNHRPRRLAGPIIALLVVGAVLAVVVVIGANTHKPTSHASSSSSSVPPSHGGTTVPSHGTGGGHGGTTVPPAGGHGQGSHPVVTTTTTTRPGPITLLNSSSTTAMWSVPNGNYTITLGATSGQCWFGVSSEGGQELFAQDVNPNQPQNLQTSGEILIDVGAPSVGQIAVNGTALTLPGGSETPFSITLQPGGGTSSTTTTTTTSGP